MPKLPVGQLRESVTTQSSGVRQDPRAAGQAGRDLQAVGGGIISLSEEVGKVKDTWDKARVTSQYTTARNSRKAQIADLLSRAKEEPDYEKSLEYKQKIEDMISEDVTIDDENVKDIYNSEAELDRSLTQTKLNEIFNHKLVNHGRGEILKDEADSEEAYIQGDLIDRVNVKASYMERLKNARDVGFLSGPEYESAIKDTDDWELNRAMRMVGENPEAVLDLISNPPREGGLELKDKNDLNKIVTMAKANIFRQGRIREIATIQSQNSNESILSDRIFNDDTLPMSEKIVLINKMEMEDEITTGFASASRRYLTSKQALTAGADHNETAKVVRMMYDANLNFDEDFDEKKYLTSVRNIQKEIMSMKGSKRDRITLQKELDTITKKKSAQATFELGKFGSDTNKTADIFFKANLPAHMTGEALRTFFYRTQGREVNEGEARKIATEISKTIFLENRYNVQNAFDAAREAVGAGADLREVKVKGGGIVIVLYEDGKRVRAVKKVRSDGRE